MSKALLVLVAACSPAAPIEVVPAPAEVVTVELPSTLTCGTTEPALSRIYVGNHTTLETACQGDAATTIVLLGDRARMSELAAHYRVIAPERADIDDLVMLIRKTSNRPVILFGDDTFAAQFAERHPELVEIPRDVAHSPSSVHVHASGSQCSETGRTCSKSRVATRPATCGRTSTNKS